MLNDLKMMVLSSNGKLERWVVLPLRSRIGRQRRASAEPRAGDRTQAEVLAGRLGGFPLALRWLGARWPNPPPGIRPRDISSNLSPLYEGYITAPRGADRALCAWVGAMRRAEHRAAGRLRYRSLHVDGKAVKKAGRKGEQVPMLLSVRADDGTVAA